MLTPLVLEVLEVLEVTVIMLVVAMGVKVVVLREEVTGDDVEVDEAMLVDELRFSGLIELPLVITEEPVVEESSLVELVIVLPKVPFCVVGAAVLRMLDVVIVASIWVDVVSVVSVRLESDVPAEVDMTVSVELAEPVGLAVVCVSDVVIGENVELLDIGVLDMVEVGNVSLDVSRRLVNVFGIIEVSDDVVARLDEVGNTASVVELVDETIMSVTDISVVTVSDKRDESVVSGGMVIDVTTVDELEEVDIRVLLSEVTDKVFEVFSSTTVVSVDDSNSSEVVDMTTELLFSVGESVVEDPVSFELLLSVVEIDVEVPVFSKLVV